MVLCKDLGAINDEYTFSVDNELIAEYILSTIRKLVRRINVNWPAMKDNVNLI